MGFLFGGGGGSSSTSVEMPPWLERVLQPMLEGTGDKFGDWQQQLWDQMMGGGGSSGGAPATTSGGNVRGGDQGRRTPDTPWNQMDPTQAWSDWNTGGWSPSSEGILGDNSRNIVGPSPWEQMAAQLSTTLTEGSPAYGKARNLFDSLTKMNSLENRGNYLAENFADPRSAAYQTKKGQGWVDENRRFAKAPVDFSGYESDPLFNQQMSAWDANVDPILTNMANSMGLGRFGVKAAAKGQSKTNAVRDALQGYIGQKNVNKDRALGGMERSTAEMLNLGRDSDARRLANIQTKLGLGSSIRSGVGDAAGGYMGLGDRAQQKKLDAISNLNATGANMRDIRQEQTDAPWEDFMRRAAAFEGSLSGPMGMMPGLFGSSSTSQKKNK